MFIHKDFQLSQLIECGFLKTIIQRQLISEQNINRQYQDKRTALHIVIISNQIQIVNYLMKFNPDLNLNDSLQLNPIDWIFKKGRQQIYKDNIFLQQFLKQKHLQKQIKNKVTILNAAQILKQIPENLFKKSNPFVKDQFGRKALHRSAIAGNLETFKYLLNKKFDPLYEDNFGFNVYHYLQLNHYNPITQFYKIKTFQQEQIKKNSNVFSQVLIIGSGAAGIGAAITLSRKGVPFRILQSRNRMGGRIVSTKIENVQLDLGACWVHSYSKNNPICKEVKKLGLKPKKSQQRDQSIIKSDLIENYKKQDLIQCQLVYKGYFEDVQKQAFLSKQDLSIQQAGREFYNDIISQLPAFKKSLVDVLINMTEHYQASSINEISAKFYEQRQDYGCDFSPQGSYNLLLNAIAKYQNIQNTIKFQTQVVKINYQKENQECYVQCKDGSIFQSNYIISSLPLGILKQEKVKFEPKIPEQHQQIINRLGWGVMNKIIVSFQKKFWQGNPVWIRLVSSQKGKYPAIYNFSTQNKHILCCFVTDNFAIKISKLSDEQIIKDFMAFLQNSFKVKNLWPKQYKITRWNQDQYSLGSYSHFGVGTNMNSSKSLRKNINQKLWIVGQHTYGQHIGCAHGAFQTGIWAAEQIIKKLKTVNHIFK